MNPYEITNIGVGLTVVILMLREILPIILNRINGRKGGQTMVVNGHDVNEIKAIVTRMEQTMQEMRNDLRQVSDQAVDLLSWRKGHESRHERDERMRERNI